MTPGQHLLLRSCKASVALAHNGSFKAVHGSLVKNCVRETYDQHLNRGGKATSLFSRLKKKGTFLVAVLFIWALQGHLPLAPIGILK